MRSLLGRFRRPISRSQLEKIGTMVLDGDGSTLSLDFTSMSSLDSRFTFTRSSTTSTYINSSGLVTTAGTNVPRFDYDPTTLAPRGLLIEGSATNLMTYSEDFNAAAWTDTSITRATGNADPAGGTTAVRFTASAGNATVIRAAAIGTSAERTFSVWLRRVTGTGNIQYTQNNGTNWTTQAITSTWTRYTFTHTVDHRVGIRIVTSGDAIEMWGAQLETGSGASSYIPTGASTVQRAADSCVMTGTNFSSWYGSPTASSVLFEGIIEQSASAYRRIFVLTSNASPNTGVPNYSVGVAGAASNRPFLNAHVNAANNVDVYVPVGAAVTNGTKFRVAARAQSGSYRISRAGQSATSTYSTAPGYPAGLITFGFVADGAFMTSQWISRLIYYPFGISDSQMDAWSA